MKAFLLLPVKVLVALLLMPIQAMAHDARTDYYKSENLISFDFQESENIALNKPTLASGEETGHPSSAAVDGDESLNSWWGANPYSQWWQVDLETVYNVDGIRIVNYYDGSRYYQYDVESSIDGVNWTTFFDYNDNTSPATQYGTGPEMEQSRLARFFRVNMSYNSANVGVHIVEFVATGVVAESFENIAKNRPTLASGNEPGHPSAAAVDGDDSRNSWWGANPYSQWWQVDLENIYELSKLGIVNYYDGNRYYQYDIESSLDGVFWEPLVDFNENTVPATKAGQEFAVQRTARYLRVNMNFNSANVGVHIVEFRAYGVEAKTYVPDDNFELALINRGHDDVLDNYIKTSVARNVSTLDLSGRLGIEDLTGIEAFTDLLYLNLFENSINELDFSKNIKLEFLNVFGVISDNPGNRLSSLDLSNNIALKHLILGGYYQEDFTSIDLSKNILLETLNVSYSASIECIQVVDVDFAINNENWVVDDPSLYSFDCSNSGRTYVPDDNFEQALINKGYDFVLDDYVNTIAIQNIDTLVLYNEQIRDLTGIEGFKNITHLDLDRNFLTQLDLTKNAKLEYLNAPGIISDNAYNDFESLDFSKNVALKQLYLNGDYYNLMVLNLSKNTLLETFQFNGFLGGRELTSLDLSNNPFLKEVSITNQEDLISVNLKNGNNQSLLNLDIRNDMFSLECVQVDDVNFAVNNADWLIDNSLLYSQDCGSNIAAKTEVNSILYPNPATNSTTLKVENVQSGYHTTVFDVSGNMVLQFSNTTNSNRDIDVTTLPKGIYLVQINTGETIETRKLLVN